MINLLKYSLLQGHGMELKKMIQKKSIVRALFFNGLLSNTEVSKLIRLSSPKVNRLLLEMMDEKMVETQGQGQSVGGRKPTIYSLVEDAFYVAGVTININQTILSLFNSMNRTLIGPLFFPVSMKSDPAIFELIKDHLIRACIQNGIDPEKIVAAGIEMPGLVNSHQGVNRTYFPEVDDLGAMLREVFGFPVFFENDAKVRAFTEQSFGLAKGRENVLMVHVNWGIGLGLIINGKLFSGKSGFSGEFGHLPVSENGFLCQCGKQGCLETLASAAAITRMALDGMAEGKPSLIGDLIQNNSEKTVIQAVIEAAYLGDQFAISLFTDAGKWLGKGIAYLIQIFNPELIIIGGSVAEGGQFMLPSIQQSIYIYCNQDISADTEIRFSQGGISAGPAGAAAMAVHRLTTT